MLGNDDASGIGRVISNNPRFPQAFPDPFVSARLT
jgi:hypothetical protein